VTVTLTDDGNPSLSSSYTFVLHVLGTLPEEDDEVLVNKVEDGELEA